MIQKDTPEVLESFSAMERESLQDRTGILERWSKVFDKSLATHVPRTLPYTGGKNTVSDVLELEDVQEEVKDEVSRGCRYMHKSHPPEPYLPIKRVQHRRRRSIEHVRPKPPGRPSLQPDKPAKTTKEQPKPTVQRMPTPKLSTALETKGEKVTKGSDFTAPVEEKDDVVVKHTPASASRHTPASSSGHPSPGRVRPREKVTTPPKSAKLVKQAKPVVTRGEPITLQTARSLRQLLFGSSYTSFNMDWRKQHINFFGSMSYGLSFYKPGPGGVMACLQAVLMKYLLYFNDTLELPQSKLQPMECDRQRALVSAMAKIMWQAGDNICAVVVLPCGECHWSTYEDYRADQLTETLVIFEFSVIEELERFIKRHLSFFENTSGNGCILLLYSVILSRTIPRVVNDLCEPNTTLMGPNDSCSQAMINLLLTGRAASNVFNGNIEYDRRGNLLPQPQQGIKKRSEIGFLSLNEHLDSKFFEFQVGSMLKTPKFPVWVVDCTDGRYGVVFCLNKGLVNDWRLERRFELHYYTGSTGFNTALDEVLTIDTRDIVDDITEDPHPVEHCLRTKWPGAVIEWN